MRVRGGWRGALIVGSLVFALAQLAAVAQADVPSGPGYSADGGALSGHTSGTDGSFKPHNVHTHGHVTATKRAQGNGAQTNAPAANTTPNNSTPAGGQSFTTLASGYSQNVFGVSSSFLGGVAFAPNGDVWADECAFSGSPLHRFALGSTYTANSTTVHSESVVPSDAGCGLTNGSDGFLYSNTSNGVTQLDASTGAPISTGGAGGNALGITADPQGKDLVYVGSDCRFGSACTIYSYDPPAGTSTPLVVLPGSEASFVDGITFDPTGNYLLLSTREPSYALTILSRSGSLVQQVPMADEPDGISFHGTSPQFVVTNNTDGTMTRFDFPNNDLTQTPSISTFASGGFRGDLSLVGSDGCIYLSQDGTRYDDGTTDSNNSIVRICPGFSPSPGVPPASNVNYAALGDSYSSGEGVQPFFSDSASNGDKCHRSAQAYSVDLAQANNWGLSFYACSGAKTNNVLFNGQYHELPQLDHFDTINPSTDLVTMTIGGNDAGFASILSHCIKQWERTLHDTFGQGNCAKDSNFTSSVHQQIINVQPKLLQTYNTLVAQTGPDTSILALDYPQIFPPTFSQENCIQLDAFVSTIDQTWFRDMTDLLDNEEGQAASDAGVNFVDVRPAFLGHAICDSQGAWLNSVDLSGGSFHPSAAGQAGYAQAAADYINNAIASGAPLTSAGFPANPGDPPSNPPTTKPPALGFDDLQVDDAQGAQTTGSCLNIYQGGQNVTLAGGGFQPGASVSLTLLVQGSSRPADVPLTTTTADSNGNISLTVRLPLGAVGIQLQNSSAGMGIVSATGNGANAGTEEDNAIIGIAPHGSDCGTVGPLPFDGFKPPVSNYPQVNAAKAGSTIPLKFSLPGVPGTLSDAVAQGYPQYAPVSCSTPAALTSGTRTSADNGGSQSGASESYNYTWSTPSSATGCQEFILKLVDGSYHEAVFNFS